MSSSSPLRHRNFRWFFIGEVVNTAGSSMSGVALAFAVLHLGGSASDLGWVVASATFPMVAFMMLGGALADRLPRALVLRGSNIVQGLAQCAIAVLVLGGEAAVWPLCLLQVVAGTAQALGYPAFHGMVPVLLGPEDRKAAYLLIGQARSGLRIVGPALAGVLVAALDPGITLLFDASTFLVAAGFLSLLHLPRPSQGSVKASVVGDLREGWAYSRALGWVLPVAVCSLAFNVLMSAGTIVLGPTIAHASSMGSAGWGLARGASAIGLFLAAFALRHLSIRHALVACQVGFLTSALPMMALAARPETGIVAGAMFISGCGSALLDLAWNLTVSEKVEAGMVSRVMSIDGFFSFIAMPLGEIGVGPVARSVGATSVEWWCAGLTVVIFLFAMLVRPVRTLELERHSAGR